MEQKKIGSFIAACRKQHGMTQVQFAEKLGVTNKAVSKWVWLLNIKRETKK